VCVAKSGPEGPLFAGYPVVSREQKIFRACILMPPAWNKKLLPPRLKTLATVTQEKNYPIAPQLARSFGENSRQQHLTM
jgi:hypothetical protein